MLEEEDQRSRRPAATEMRSTASVDLTAPVNVKLPYFPGGRQSNSLSDDKRDQMLEKLVLKLQTPESESMPALSMGELGNAVKVAT